MTDDNDLTPLTRVTVTCQLDCLSGGRLGLGVFTEGQCLTAEGNACLDALLATIQDFCTLNEFPVNVRRPMQ